MKSQVSASTETKPTTPDQSVETVCDDCQPSRRWVAGSRWRDTIKLCPKHAAADALYQALKKLLTEGLAIHGDDLVDQRTIDQAGDAIAEYEKLN